MSDNKKISNNFWLSEWACNCGCGLNSIDLRLMPIAEIIRHHEGDNPMVPNSACRCVEHNEKVQKQNNPDYISLSSRSMHMPDENGLCKAVDFHSKDPLQLYYYLDGIFSGIYGIGVYNWGVHVDTAKRYARWNRI